MTNHTEITEALRELFTATPPAPYPVVWRLLRERAQQRKRHEQEISIRACEAAQSIATLADDVGLALHQLRDFVRISGPGLRSAGLSAEAALLDTITSKFEAALRQAGAQVIEPTGRPYPEVADAVEVVHAEPGTPLAQLVVTGTVQAGLRMADGELVRRAKVELGAAAPDLNGIVPTTGGDRRWASPSG